MSDRIATVRFRALIDAAAMQVGLPNWIYRGQAFLGGEWLEGLILAESNGDPRARRYEPHQDRANRRDAAGDSDHADIDDGILEDDASYGLMQVMGYNARVLVGVAPGTSMRFGWLFLPMGNIALGLRVLCGELAAVSKDIGLGRAPASQHVERALARYNGGPTGDDDVDGDIRLRRYVDRVASHAGVARRDRNR